MLNSLFLFFNIFQEAVFKEIEERIKQHSRILQKRESGNDIKFQVIPPKSKKNENETTNK